MKRRVVVTGTGCVSVLGETTDALIAGLLAGRSGITRWKTQPAFIYSKIGGDLSQFDFESRLRGWPNRLAERARTVMRAACPAAKLVAASLFEALREGNALGLPDEAMGHVVGTHNANERFIFEQAREFEREPEYLDPMYGVVAFDTDIAAASNEVFGIRGPSFTVGGACASSNVAIVVAQDMIRAGRADRVAVSGVAMTTSPLALQGWAFIDALALDRFVDEPMRASRPFDVSREGFVPSEGAGVVLLESLDSACSRGATIKGEVLGGAITSSGCRGTRTDIQGQTKAIAGALSDASVAHRDVTYINAHGTSTQLGDANEMEALRRVFGDHLRNVAINSTKSMLGHTLQAAGLLELIAIIGQMERGYLHPTINLDNRDPAFSDLDLVVGEARRHPPGLSLSNSFGFGGINAVIVAGPFEKTSIGQHHAGH